MIFIPFLLSRDRIINKFGAFNNNNITWELSVECQVHIVIKRFLHAFFMDGISIVYVCLDGGGC